MTVFLLAMACAQCTGGAQSMGQDDDNDDNDNNNDGDEDTDENDSDTEEDVPSRIFISEVMYHPVLEESYEELHEFVELYNGSDSTAKMKGWKIKGSIGYAFDNETTIPPRGYLVVAKNKAELIKTYGNALNADGVVGDYTGELPNGSGTVLLQNGSGNTADSLIYDDGFPWPVGADGLGAGESWLPPELLPLEAHRHRGYSLERISFEVETCRPFNWTTSVLDRPTPGAENTAALSEPLPIVEAFPPSPTDRT